MARDFAITMGTSAADNITSFILGFPTDVSATPPIGARTPMHNNPIYDTHESTPYFGRSRPGRGMSSANEVSLNDAGHVVNLFQEPHSRRREDGRMAIVAASDGPVSPVWNRKRPFLTGAHLWQNNQSVFYGPGEEEFQRPAKMSRSSEDCSSSLELTRSNSIPGASRVQEAVILDDLLNSFMGLNGQYISFEFPGRSGKKDVICNLRAGLDPGLHASVSRVLPVCEDIVVLQQFVETRLKRESGMVCHAVAAAIRGILDDWLLLVTQLENLLRVGRLTMQSLWHYINPPSSVIKLLAKFAREAATQQLVGRSLLNLLYHHLRINTGNRSSQSVLQKLLTAACVPYFEILGKWVCEGVLDDPYGEFIVQENSNIGLLSTTHDLQSAYWRDRYSLRWSSPQFEGDGRMPNFLEEHEEMIMTTGKYLSALRECGKPVQNVLGSGCHIEYEPSNQFVRQIHKAHEAAGKAFLDFFMKDLKLIQRLRAIKHFFLLDKGDMITSLLDFADEELSKQPNLVSHTRMQSLLELAVRTSSIPQDTDFGPLAFGFDSRSLLEMARSVFKRKAIGSTVARSQVKTQEERDIAYDQTKDIKGFQVFTLSYKVDWPMTLVVAPKHMQQYQLLFRHMFLLKKLERDLGKVWQTLQISRRLQADGQMGKHSRTLSSICHKMMHTFQQYVHYVTVDTVEPLWEKLEAELQKAKDINSVIALHQNFILKVLKHSLLYKARIVILIEKLEDHALHFVELILGAIKPHGDLQGPVNSSRSAAERYAKVSVDDLAVEKALTDESFSWEVEKVGVLFAHKVNELIKDLKEIYDNSACDRSEAGRAYLESGEEVMKLQCLIERLHLCG